MLRLMMIMMMMMMMMMTTLLMMMMVVVVVVVMDLCSCNVSLRFLLKVVVVVVKLQLLVQISHCSLRCLEAASKLGGVGGGSCIAAGSWAAIVQTDVTTAKRTR